MYPAVSPQNKFLPYIALMVGIICLSFSAIFVRWANAPGPVIAFYRLGLASIILAPFLLKRLNSIKITKLILFFPLMGGMFTAFDHAVWNTSVMYTTAANATLLGNTAPLWVALAAWLIFKEQLKRRFWIGLGLTLSGAVIVLGIDFLLHPHLGLGDLLAILAGFFYAGYLLITQQGRKYLDALPYICFASFIGSIFLLGISLGLKMPLTGYPTQTYLAFLGSALVPQVLGYISIAYALGHLPASTVSPTLIGQPVTTALLAIPLLGETPHAIQILGGVFVLWGILMVHRSRERRAGKKLAADAA
jgi:drug/metabolite transporter (DMT)-like permease